MNQADKDAQKWMEMNQKVQYQELIRAKESGDPHYIDQHGVVITEEKMTDGFLQLIKDHLIKYPESVDSQLWNDRVQVLIHRVKEIEAEKDKEE